MSETTELTTTKPNAAPVVMGFSNLASFEFMQRTARMFSASTMVPVAYQAIVTKGYGNKQVTEPNQAAVSNCMIALDMSQRMNANPLMIMQNLHIIEGRPSWSSQFIIAAINNSGKFSPLRFDLQWLDEIDANYSTFEWVDGRKMERKNAVKIKNARCVAWAIERATGERLESALVTMEMAVNEGWYGKNGSKWKSMPDLMMRYRSAAFFGRIYAPELLMGLPAVEELQDVFSVDENGAVTESRQPVQRSMGTIDANGEIVPEEPVMYPADKFDKSLPKWLETIAAGKKTADEIITWLESKGKLTEAQKAQIKAVPVATVVDAPAPAPVAAPAQAPAPATPTVTFAQVNEKLLKAANMDQLNEAADLINSIEDLVQQDELIAVYERRLGELE